MCTLLSYNVQIFLELSPCIIVATLRQENDFANEETTYLPHSFKKKILKKHNKQTNIFIII